MYGSCASASCSAPNKAGWRKCSSPASESSSSSAEGGSAEVVSSQEVVSTFSPGAEHQGTDPSRDSEDCSAPLDVNYIPIFGSTANILIQRHAQCSKDDRPGCSGEALAHGGAGSSAVRAKSGKENMVATTDAADLAANMQQMRLTADLQQHSLQLALDSSADWHPHPLDTLVAVMGAPPAWLCGGETSGSFDFFGNSRLAACSGAEPPPVHVPKLCVTVSTVSSQLDSLAILPLCTPQPAPAEPSPRELTDSRHLGEF